MTEYEPTRLVSLLHDAPRFGRDNSVSALLSSDEQEQGDYIHGLVGWSIFVIVAASIWIMVLLTIKIRWGINRVGCAAGGDIVDVDWLRSVVKLKKRQRTTRILRNWRVQTLFLVCCLAIPIITLLLVNQGLNPLLTSLQDFAGVTDEVDSLAHKGIRVATSLEKLGRSMEKSSSQLTLDSLCPEYATSEWANTVQLSSFKDQIEAGFSQATDWLSRDLWRETTAKLHDVTQATDAVQDVVRWIYDHDWMLKMFLLALNIVAAFFVGGVLLTKHAIDFSAYQAMMTLMMVPAFVILWLGCIVAACAFGIAAFANADACSGGPLPGSPIGTIQDIVLTLGHDNDSHVYKSIDYYASSCLTDNPLQFLEDLQFDVGSATNSLRTLIDDFESLNNTAVSLECGVDDMQPAKNKLEDLEETLQSVRMNIKSAVGLTSCSSVSPILRRLSYGTTCRESVEGLAWLYGTMLGLSFCGLLILTTRAALYNPVILPRKRLRREREFEEYRQYMSQFYDTTDWKLDPPPKKTFLIHGNNTLTQLGLPHGDTFDTDDSSLDSPKSASMERTGASSDNSTPDVEPNSSSLNDSYYSTESEDDDGHEGSVMSSAFSFISSVVGRFFAKNNATGRGDNALGPRDDDDASRDSDRVIDEVALYTSSPSFLTPRQRRRRSPQNALHEANPSELEPFTPSPPAIKAPQKNHKALSRTLGGKLV